MREIALHLLDLLENAMRARAGRIRLTIALDEEREWLLLCVEDDGPGLPVGPDQALDPFFTTKSGKKTGLGLSLFRAASEQAGGALALRKSALGGLAVEATMKYRHMDRMPLGDVGETVMSCMLTRPDIRIECRIHGPAVRRELIYDPADVPRHASPFAAARDFSHRVRAALSACGIEE